MQPQALSHALLGPLRSGCHGAEAKQGCTGCEWLMDQSASRKAPYQAALRLQFSWVEREDTSRQDTEGSWRKPWSMHLTSLTRAGA